MAVWRTGAGKRGAECGAGLGHVPPKPESYDGRRCLNVARGQVTSLFLLHVIYRDSAGFTN